MVVVGVMLGRGGRALLLLSSLSFPRGPASAFNGSQLALCRGLKGASPEWTPPLLAFLFGPSLAGVRCVHPPCICFLGELAAVGGGF